jgi:hypothetical protein
MCRRQYKKGTECMQLTIICKSKIIKRVVKIQMHKTLIRSVVMYGSETWPLTKSDENLLRNFDWKILRKI